MLKGKFLKAFLRRCKKLGSEVLAHATDDYCRWSLLGCSEEEEGIPKDVPRGHMVVYVGEQHKRYVIQVAYLENPLFQTLLDKAREEYEYNPDSKLCLPCDETSFLSILYHVSSLNNKKIWLCI